jgi:hypothetical protein
LPHGGDQHHDGRQIDLPTQEPHGGRRTSLATMVSRAAEAQPAAARLRHRNGTAWLAGIAGGVQTSPARTARLAD